MTHYIFGSSNNVHLPMANTCYLSLKYVSYQRCLNAYLNIWSPLSVNLAIRLPAHLANAFLRSISPLPHANALTMATILKNLPLYIATHAVLSPWSKPTLSNDAFYKDTQA